MITNIILLSITLVVAAIYFVERKHNKKIRQQAILFYTAQLYKKRKEIDSYKNALYNTTQVLNDSKEKYSELWNENRLLKESSHHYQSLYMSEVWKSFFAARAYNKLKNA